MLQRSFEINSRDCRRTICTGEDCAAPSFRNVLLLACRQINSRTSSHKRWLIRYDLPSWSVYQHHPRAKVSRILCVGYPSKDRVTQLRLLAWDRPPTASFYKSRRRATAGLVPEQLPSLHKTLLPRWRVLSPESTPPSCAARLMYLQSLRRTTLGSTVDLCRCSCPDQRFDKRSIPR